MSRRTEVALALTLLLASGAGCVRREPVAEVAQVGHHRVRFVLPRGWERLDHGREQLFRSGETQLSLADHGPATREALAAELRAAERLWHEGRQKDAVQRVRELMSGRLPALQNVSQEQRALFRKPWTDATYMSRDAADPAIGAAFEPLVAGTATLAEMTPGRTLEYVLGLTTDMQRNEVARRRQRIVHGAEWTDVETWNRVSHMGRSRVAFMDDGGHLLVLAMDRGFYERAAPGFEALLASLEVKAADPDAR